MRAHWSGMNIMPVRCVGCVRECESHLCEGVVKVPGEYVFIAFLAMCGYAAAAIVLSLHVLDGDLKIYEKLLAVGFMLGTLTYFCYVFYRFCKKI